MFVTLGCLALSPSEEELKGAEMTSLSWSEKYGVRNNRYSFPVGYVPYRQDRKRGGGGVFIAVKDCYPTSLIDLQGIDKNSEQIWVKVALKTSKDLLIGSFYKPPTDTKDSVQHLGNVLNKVKTKGDKTVILGSDFNARGIDWDSEKITEHCSHPTMCEDLIKLINDAGLTQLQREPTRESSLLDLYITNKPGLVKHHQTIPGISDHDMIVVDSFIKPIHNMKKPRQISLFSKAKWDDIRKELKTFSNSFENNSTNENWNTFKTNLKSIMDRFIPTKKISGRHHLQWITSSLR